MTLDEALKLTTVRCHLAIVRGLKWDTMQGEDLIQLYMDMGMQKFDHILFKFVMENLHGPQTDEQLTFNALEERYYTLLTNDVASYVAIDANEDFVPLRRLEEFHYGMAKNVFGLAFLLEQKLLRHDQVKIILKDLFTKEVVGYDLLDYLFTADYLNEPEVDFDSVIKDVMAAMPDAVKDYKNGKEKALGSLIGAVLKKVKGSPSEIKNRLKTLLTS